MKKVIRKEILMGAAIAFVAMCLLTALLYGLLTHPRAIKLADIRSKLDAKQSELEGLSTERVQKLIAQADKCRSELSEYMLMANQQGELSIRLRKLAAESKLVDFSSKDTQSSAGQGISSANLEEQRIRISFSGDFSGFADFLYAMEKNRPVIFLDGFTIAHDSRDNTRITAEMDASVFCEAKGKKQM
jgi:hypothetical protein